MPLEGRTIEVERERGERWRERERGVAKSLVSMLAPHTTAEWRQREAPVESGRVRRVN